MNSISIERKLNSYSQFLGVFPSDIHCLPIIKKYPSCLISNTDDHNLPGTHWIAMYFKNKNYVEYFDSYGNKPFILSHMKYMEKYASNIKYNDKIVQGQFSTTCAGHCIYYIHLKCNNYSLNDIMKIYSDNYHFNDAFIYKMFH